MSSTLSREEEIRVLDGQAINEKLSKAVSPAQANRYIYDAQHPLSGGVPAGFSSWADWRRWTVTEFVSLLSETVHPIKPWLRISAAALGNYNWGGWNGYHTVFQDAALWFNQGYLDQLTPMHYHWVTNTSYDVQGFKDMLIGENGDNSAHDCWGRYILPGLDAGRLFSCGPNSVTLDGAGRWVDPEPLVPVIRNIP